MKYFSAAGGKQSGESKLPEKEDGLTFRAQRSIEIPGIS